MRQGSCASDAAVASSAFRYKKTLLASLGAVVLLAGAYGAAVTWKARQHTVSIERVRGNLYLLVASGMNVAALVTDEGVVLVDSMQAGWWGPAALEKIRTVTDKPVVAIINTNSHPAHSANNEFFANPRTRIFAQTNTRSRLVKSARFQGEAARYLPHTTFEERLSITIGNEPIDLYYFGAANTDGDAWVVFPRLGVMHAGDVVVKDDVPEIVPESGGSGVAHSATLAKALSSIKGVDLVITGHGINDAPRPILTWRELEDQQRLSHDLLTSVRTTVQQKMAREDALVSVRSLDRFRIYERDVFDAAAGVMYDELMTGALVREPESPSPPAAGPQTPSPRADLGLKRLAP